MKGVNDGEETSTSKLFGESETMKEKEKGLENGYDDCKVVEERCRGDWTSRAFAEEGITVTKLELKSSGQLCPS